MAGETQKCPACAETIQATAQVCRFCRYDFNLEQIPAAPPAPSRNWLPIVLVVLACVLVAPCAIGVMAALILPATVKALENTKKVACANNLQQLYKLQLSRAAMSGVSKRSLTAERGSEFWLELSRTSPPLVQSDELFSCALKGPSPAGGCDYRGPSGDVNVYDKDDPVGADKVGNHGAGQGGNVLLKDGSVHPVSEADPLWIAAGRKTRP